jgi:hypothetical protein
VPVERDLAGVEGLVEGAAEHRQAQLAAPGLPVDVEPVGGRGLAAVAEGLPQRCVRVLRGHERHVVGHDVDHDAEAVGPGGLREGDEPLLPAELGVDPGVVEDVVAVL